ncbi:MAG: hypothetical protein ACI4F9_05490 [Lachnospiraceae bacterium]
MSKRLRRLRKEDFGELCRKCINEKYHINLQPEDCYYCIYKYECSQCKKVKNIVFDIGFLSRWKLYIHSSKREDES